jgi:hypothetical protein
MSKVQHSVKLVSYDSIDLDRLSYTTGDVVFDSTNTTLRVMDGVNQGGVQLLRADLANAQGALGVTISETPPASPKTGSLWFNSSNGALYIYYTDDAGSQWIQPVAAPGQVTVAPDYVLLPATTSVLGGVIADNSTILVNNGVLSIRTANGFIDASFVGSTITGRFSDPVTLTTSGTSSITYNWSTDSSFYYTTGLTSNYTAAFTNVPTTANKHYLINILIVQGSTGYYPSAITINGASTPISWCNGIDPIPSTNFKDLVSFNLFYISGTWTVTGNFTSFKKLN